MGSGFTVYSHGWSISRQSSTLHRYHDVDFFSLGVSSWCTNHMDNIKDSDLTSSHGLKNFYICNVTSMFRYSNACDSIPDNITEIMQVH